MHGSEPYLRHSGSRFTLRSGYALEELECRWFLAADVMMSLGAIPSGQSRTVEVDLLVDNPLAKGISVIENQATIKSNFPDVVTAPASTTIYRAPQVADVFINGASTASLPGWSPSFLTQLQNAGQGDATFGYRIPSGAGQLNEIPWLGANTVAIRFTEDVDVSAGDLVIHSANSGTYALDDTLFAYNASSLTATWQLHDSANPFFLTDKIRLELDGDPGGVTDAAGHQLLDGEWNDSIATFPSGNGVSGGDFLFEAVFSNGDANRDGGTSSADIVNVRQTINRGDYDLFFDINADGGVSVADLTNTARRIPAAVPTSTPGGTVGSGWIAHAVPETPLGPGVQPGGLEATKTATLLFDIGGDGQPNPGDAIRYTITITNNEATDATGVLLEDYLSNHLSLVNVNVLNAAPVITSDGGGLTANVNAPENQTAATTVTAMDFDVPVESLTFSISGGADAALFDIGPTSGVLTFKSAPNFENPADNGGNNVYDVQVSVTDNGTPNLSTVQDIAIQVTNVNEPPIINSHGGGSLATVLVPENTPIAAVVTVTDDDLPWQSLEYSITGGLDAAKFSIPTHTGVLTFNSLPDFENPTDAGADNVYNVEVTVTDNGSPSLTDMQHLAIVVQDLPEATVGLQTDSLLFLEGDSLAWRFLSSCRCRERDRSPRR